MKWNEDIINKVGECASKNLFSKSVFAKYIGITTGQLWYWEKKHPLLKSAIEDAIKNKWNYYFENPDK